MGAVAGRQGRREVPRVGRRERVVQVVLELIGREREEISPAPNRRWSLSQSSMETYRLSDKVA